MKRATSDANGSTPLYEQLCESLRADIASGRLAPGTRLPSTRTLARELRLSRNTVVAAYEQLVLEGLLIATVGSGTRVSGKKPARADLRAFLSESGYPSDSVHFVDCDGNNVYVHR
jgi:DNA-binding GntR family transcriptional regulator